LLKNLRVLQTNILIGDDCEALISDFGLAAIEDAAGNPSAGRGSDAWLAPERCINPSGKRTYAMDVYAYACICYMVRVLLQTVFQDAY
jgi:serine/threonine protein kinase